MTPAGKVPTLIPCVGAGGEVVPFYFAGLFASWRPKDPPNANGLETFTLLTREAWPELRMMHDRMPVIQPTTAYSAWLDRTMTSSTTATELVSASTTEGFHQYPVSTLGNSPKNDSVACMAPATH